LSIASWLKAKFSKKPKSKPLRDLPGWMDEPRHSGPLAVPHPKPFLGGVYKKPVPGGALRVPVSRRERGDGIDDAGELIITTAATLDAITDIETRPEPVHHAPVYHEPAHQPVHHDTTTHHAPVHHHVDTHVSHHDGGGSVSSDSGGAASAAGC
jgi:hypothetical protein